MDQELPEHLRVKNTDACWVMFRGIPMPFRKSEVAKWEASSRTEKNVRYRKIKLLIKEGLLVVIKNDSDEPITITKMHHEWLQKIAHICH